MDIKPSHSQKQRRRIYKYTKANWEQIKADCKNILQVTINMVNNNSTIEEVWESFKQGITDSISKNVPTKLSSTRISLPWINNKIRKMLRRKQRLYTVKTIITHTVVPGSAVSRPFSGISVVPELAAG